MCTPTLTCMFTHFDIHTYTLTHFSAQTDAFAAMLTCFQMVSLTHTHTHTHTHTQAHTHTLTFSHRGAINLDGADEKGSRGYGESVRVGVAVTVTGLGGLACLANTASDVERGTVFHHLEKTDSENDANTSAGVSAVLIKCVLDAEGSLQVAVSRGNKLMPKKEIRLLRGIHRCKKNSPH